MKVRALVDIPGTDIKSGDFFEASSAVAKGLVAVGDADDKAKESDVYPDGAIPEAKQHPSAVAVATAETDLPSADDKAKGKK